MSGPGSPFDLADAAAYRGWRERKLAAAAGSIEELVVPVADPARPSAAERSALIERCRCNNMALFRTDPGRADVAERVRALCAALGQHTLVRNPYADPDGVSALRVRPGGQGGDYIPYTDREMNWHTDGYYNEPGRRIRGMVLFCARPAAEGGETLLLDHELAYIALRDAGADIVSALMAPDAMTIPANQDDSAVARGDRSGPVLAVDPRSGALEMRYTARRRGVRWKADPRLDAARGVLGEVIHDGAPGVLRRRLEAGEGLICNNVLLRRTAFGDPADSPGRLVYRLRFAERVAGTDPQAAAADGPRA